MADSWIDFTAGWCSGAVAVVALQPLDTVLTRWQAGLLRSSLVAETRAWTSSLGLAALWRGSSPMISAVPMQNALLMSGYGVGQKYAGDSKLTGIFIGGCTGGVLQSFLMSPVELFKIKQQCAGQSYTGLWRGLSATLLRDGVPHGAWFWAYDVAKTDLAERWGQDSMLVPLTAGAVAAATAWGVGYPADLIKTRIQYRGGGGIIEVGREIVAEAGGLHGLYRGFGLKLVRAVPASMIGFSVYEMVKKQLERNL